MRKVSEKIKKCCVGALRDFDLFRQKTFFLVNNKSFSKINTQLFLTEPKKSINDQLIIW